MFKNSKAIQRCAFGMLLTVDPGAFLVLVKLLLGSFRIAVDLPTAAAFAAVGPLTDETLHILRGIAQKKPDFMGKILGITTMPLRMVYGIFEKSYKKWTPHFCEIQSFLT